MIVKHVTNLQIWQTLCIIKRPFNRDLIKKCFWKAKLETSTALLYKIEKKSVNTWTEVVVSCKWPPATAPLEAAKETLCTLGGSWSINLFICPMRLPGFLSMTFSGLLVSKSSPGIAIFLSILKSIPIYNLAKTSWTEVRKIIRVLKSTAVILNIWHRIKVSNSPSCPPPSFEIGSVPGPSRFFLQTASLW